MSLNHRNTRKMFQLTTMNNKSKHETWFSRKWYEFKLLLECTIPYVAKAGCSHESKVN